MYWKYHIKAGDLVHFGYHDDEVGYLRAWGTVVGIGLADDADYPRDDEGNLDVPTEEIDFADFVVKIKSGNETILTTVDEVHDRTKKEDREGDGLEDLAERFRLSGGIEQARRELAEKMGDDK